MDSRDEKLDLFFLTKRQGHCFSLCIEEKNSYKHKIREGGLGLEIHQKYISLVLGGALQEPLHAYAQRQPSPLLRPESSETVVWGDKKYF